MEKKKTKAKEPKKVEKKKEKGVKINKKIVLLIVCAVVFLAIVITASAISINKNRDTDEIVLEKLYNDIYEWEYEIKDKDIVKLESKKNTGDIKGETQVKKVKQHFVFKALKKGKTDIKFVFRNTGNGSYMGIKHYDVTVDDNLKLTIKEKTGNQ